MDIWTNPFHPHGPTQVPLDLLDRVDVPEPRWVVASWTGHLELMWLSNAA